MADENIITKPAAEQTPANERTWSGCYRPNCDIVETADELRVIADLPGATADGVDLNFEDGTLTIHAKVAPRDGENRRYLLREYGVGDFYRTFEVAETIDPSRITADLRDGVLTLHLPKAEAAKPRKISITGG